MAKLTPAPSLTSTRSIYKDLINATSSQASAAGLMRYALRDGRIADLFGLEVVPANPSPSQDKAEAWTIQGIYGPTSFGSSVPSGPLSYWENRLRDRLATVGSTEFELIWKKLATPAGRSIFRLSRSTPRTFASDSTGLPATWATPTTRDWKDGAAPSVMNSGRTDKLSHAVFTATWPTPTKADGDGGHTMGTASVTGKREDGSKITVSLPGVVKIVSAWPTPLQQDCRVPATPESAQREWDHSNLRGIAAVTTWPTPTSQDCARGVGTIRPQDTGIPLPQRVAQVIGTTTSGSPDQTEKPGALNPAFPCWLMGYPEDWLWCAPEKTGPKKRTPTTE